MHLPSKRTHWCCWDAHTAIRVCLCAWNINEERSFSRLPAGAAARGWIIDHSSSLSFVTWPPPWCSTFSDWWDRPGAPRLLLLSSSSALLSAAQTSLPPPSLSGICPLSFSPLYQFSMLSCHDSRISVFNSDSHHFSFCKCTSLPPAPVLNLISLHIGSWRDMLVRCYIFIKNWLSVSQRFKPEARWEHFSCFIDSLFALLHEKNCQNGLGGRLSFCCRLHI